MPELLKAIFLFSGRLTRLPFFLLFILNKAILISSLIGGKEGVLYPYFSYLFLISIWVDLSLVSSRLKDIGRSRLWIIAGLFGLPLVLYCFFASSAKRDATINTGGDQLGLNPVEEKADQARRSTIFSNSDDRFKR